MMKKEFWQELMNEIMAEGILSAEECSAVMRHLEMEVET